MRRNANTPTWHQRLMSRPHEFLRDLSVFKEPNPSAQETAEHRFFGQLNDFMQIPIRCLTMIPPLPEWGRISEDYDLEQAFVQAREWINLFESLPGVLSCSESSQIDWRTAWNNEDAIFDILFDITAEDRGEGSSNLMLKAGDRASFEYIVLPSEDADGYAIKWRLEHFTGTWCEAYEELKKLLAVTRKEEMEEIS